MHNTDPENAWIAREWLAGRKQREIGEDIGVSTSVVCSIILRFCNKWTDVDFNKFAVYNEKRRMLTRTALMNYFLGTDGTIIKPGKNPPDPWQLADARKEHAWLLRAEGATYTEIAARLGVHHTRARQLVVIFGRRVQRALRCVRVDRKNRKH